MIDFKKWYCKIKETKKFANERNVHNWFNILLHSVLFCLVGGTALSLGLLVLTADLEIHSNLKDTILMNMIWEFNKFSMFIFAGILALLFMERMIKLQVLAYEKFNKFLFNMWQRFDMWYYRKYRKHSPLTEGLSKLQEKASKNKRKLSKNQKRMVTIIVIGVMLLILTPFRIIPMIENISNDFEEIEEDKNNPTVTNPIEEKPMEIQVTEGK